MHAGLIRSTGMFTFIEEQIFLRYESFDIAASFSFALQMEIKTAVREKINDEECNSTRDVAAAELH